MNLKNKTILERKQLTNQFPVLLPGANASGKTTAIEQMSTEDKKRTIVLNFDSKPIGKEVGEFAASFAVAGNRELLESQMAALPADAEEYRKHFQQILATSYFIDDDEVIDKIVGHINKAAFSPKIDRIILDSFSSMVDFVESWANTNFSGRDVWSNYGFGVQKILQALKEASLHGVKFVYVFTHHAHIPAAQYATTPKEVVAVKGGIMKNNIEVYFSTIIYSHVTEDGKRMFSCDSDSTLDTSRTKLVDSRFSFERTSLDDIEQFLNNKATIEDFKLVPIKSK